MAAIRTSGTNGSKRIAEGMVWILAAWAAEPVLVAGVEGSRSLLLLGEREGVLDAATCNDAGQAPDQAPDGRWTCSMPAGERLALLRDGRLVELPCTAPKTLLLDKKDVGCDVALPGAKTVPESLSAPQILVRVQVPGEGGTPVLALEGERGRVELACRNDGRFPDATRNDEEFGCAGVSPGNRLKLVLNAGDGSHRQLGELSWPAELPLRFAQIDVLQGKNSSDAFSASLSPPEVIAPPTPPDAPTTPTPPEPTPPSPPPPVPVPMESPQAAPHRPLALGITFVLGLFGGWWLRRPAKLPASLRPLPVQLEGLPPIEGPHVVRGISASALLDRLHRHRVLLVGEQALPTGVQGWLCRSTDLQEVQDAVVALARTPGLPIAVVLCQPLQDPGGVAGHPAVKLAESLPEGSLCLALLPADQPGWGWPELQASAEGAS